MQSGLKLGGDLSARQDMFWYGGRLGLVGLLLVMALAVGCGARDAVALPEDAGQADADTPQAETCDGLDNDQDGLVDETFRDGAGLYMTEAHCGACGEACPESLPFATGAVCALGPRGPRCEAEACAPDFARNRDGLCSPQGEHLCLPCQADSECGDFASSRCATISGLRRCVVDCGASCPANYVCGEDDSGASTCLPPSGSCVCGDGMEDFTFACATELGGSCPGRRSCTAGELSACEGPAERCDGADNDCDGEVDESFVDEAGFYSVDALNCGRCGVDCTIDNGDVPLTCGGDPFAPTCVVDCPDLRDGKDVGDFVDADGRIDTACECQVASLLDGFAAPGDSVRDDNCDGAEGEVRSALYVASDGDDGGPGSPTRPLRTIGEALLRAAPPRMTILVAAGTYAESLRLRDGVTLLGGYRRDFLERDVSRHAVYVAAPQDATAPFGAALWGQEVGANPTLVSGLVLQGRDATGSSEPAVAAVLDQPGAALALEHLVLRTGRPGEGAVGRPGAIGQGPRSQASPGQPPRAAREDLFHECIDGAANTSAGGAGGANVCGAFDVSGGRGGGVRCPIEGDREAGGLSGRGAALSPGGPGGLGGYHVTGPIFRGSACDRNACCGLADFQVPDNYEQARPGVPGVAGAAGGAGAGCNGTLGAFTLVGYEAPVGGAGVAGLPGGGGGGGGAGGGSEFLFIDGVCPYEDGLGGSGGGGGAGGCGGEGGSGGEAGGSAVGLLIRGDRAALPELRDLTFAPLDGAAGGRGGDGGDGGPGGAGANGGSLPRELRSTPTLAGPASGEQGGSGGPGGPGGGGGGGCGGASVGLWVASGSIRAGDLSAVMMENDFELGSGGARGPGGGGAVPGQDGSPGFAEAVIKQ